MDYQKKDRRPFHHEDSKNTKDGRLRTERGAGGKERNRTMDDETTDYGTTVDGRRRAVGKAVDDRTTDFPSTNDTNAEE